MLSQNYSCIQVHLLGDFKLRVAYYDLPSIHMLVSLLIASGFLGGFGVCTLLVIRIFIDVEGIPLPKVIAARF